MGSVSTSDILILIALLQVKHALCDGPLQTYAMIKEKGYYGRPGGIIHAAIHGAGSLGVLLFFGIAALPALALAGIEMLLHYHIDFIKETIARRFAWTYDRAQFWWALMADQMLHQLTYLAMAYAVLSI